MADEIDGAHLWFACVLFFLLGFLVEGEDGGSVAGNFLGAMADMFVYLWLATWWCWTGLLIFLGFFLLLVWWVSATDSAPISGTVKTEQLSKEEKTVPFFSMEFSRAKVNDLSKSREKKRSKKSTPANREKVWLECRECGCMFKDTPGPAVCKSCYYHLSEDLGEGY